MTTAADPLRADDPVLEGLNAGQFDAVTHGEGPILIVAGAGTGKTQVVTRRIAWLIASGRARPEQILALTFTDKAAAEMEARVDQLVPYGLVGATLSTFHAFCDRLVREHAVELGLTSPLRVESDAEILVFLRERLFDLGLKRYLPLGRPDAHLRAFAGLIDRARNEDISAERYRAFAAQLVAEAGDDPEKRDRAESETEKALVYTRYEQMLLSAGRLDFGSQIALALRLLRERAWVRRQVQDRYRWILVDEFQDTNRVQFELVRLLAGERRNLTVVGDDDQSIYRFRGARVENLLGFLEAFPDAREVLLTENYRSGQRILDVAHTLIRHNDPARLEAMRGYDKRLRAQRASEGGGPFEGEVLQRTYATGSDEADAIAADLEGLIVEGRYRASECAVLARAHAHLDPVALALKARGIRFRRVGLRGLYSRPEVTLCLMMLRSVADPGDSMAAYLALADPLFGADPSDLATLASRADRTLRPLLVVARDERETADVAAATRTALSRFLVLHGALSARAAHRPTTDVLYEFVTESGLLARLTETDTPENLERVQNLDRLFRIVTRIGPLLRVDRVKPFVEHLDLLIEMGDDPAAAEVDSDDEAVSLLTVHNAKGLEFAVVHLVDLVEQRFPPYRRGDELPLPPELRQGGADDPEDHMREERRLFYVGLTRARDRLVLGHATDYGGRRATRLSRFVQEALELPAAPKGARGATALESIARHAPTPEPPPGARAAIAPSERLDLSHGQIEDYLACPLRYHYAHRARVPLAANPQIMYGTAIHHAIRIWHEHRMRGHPIRPDDVLAAFDSAWSNEGFLTPEHESRRRDEGHATLRRFMEEDQAAERLPLAIEASFEFLQDRDRITGRWDRIDERPEGIVLVDYKSSEVVDADKARARAKESARDGQLGLYALAYREARKALPATVELRFVGSGLTGSVQVEEDHLERAQTRIRQASEGIRAARFAATPDVRTCEYCPYSRFCPERAVR